MGYTFGDPLRAIQRPLTSAGTRTGIPRCFRHMTGNLLRNHLLRHTEFAPGFLVERVLPNNSLCGRNHCSAGGDSADSLAPSRLAGRGGFSYNLSLFVSHCGSCQLPRDFGSFAPWTCIRDGYRQLFRTTGRNSDRRLVVELLSHSFGYPASKALPVHD